MQGLFNSCLWRVLYAALVIAENITRDKALLVDRWIILHVAGFGLDLLD